MKKLRLIAIFLLLSALFISLVGCDRAKAVDYSAQNSFDVSVEDSKTALTFSPKGVKATYGLIFYQGTAISADHYSYLGEALAAQGYVVVIPKTNMGMAFYGYSATEPAFERFKDVRFFVGGHSQGGGAAVRRAQDNADKVKGLILLAPLCYTLKKGMFEGSENSEGDFYNVADKDIPALILDASNDRVLSSSQRAASSECVNASLTTRIEISPGAHMSFSTLDDDATLATFLNDGDGISEQEKQAQREKTVQYILAFLNRVVTGENQAD